MTSSAGISGLIFAGSPPWSRIASRIAARSTIAGTPVKSWRSTRAGMNEISCAGSASADQLMIGAGSPPLRTTFSSRILSVYGRRAAFASRRWISYLRSPTLSVAIPRFNQRAATGRRPPSAHALSEDGEVEGVIGQRRIGGVVRVDEHVARVVAGRDAVAWKRGGGVAHAAEGQEQRDCCEHRSRRDPDGP